jgi:hypothetical protein
MGPGSGVPFKDHSIKSPFFLSGGVIGKRPFPDGPRLIGESDIPAGKKTGGLQIAGRRFLDFEPDNARMA